MSFIYKIYQIIMNIFDNEFISPDSYFDKFDKYPQRCHIYVLVGYDIFIAWLLLPNLGRK